MSRTAATAALLALAACGSSTSTSTSPWTRMPPTLVDRLYGVPVNVSEVQANIDYITQQGGVQVDDRLLYVFVAAPFTGVDIFHGNVTQQILSTYDGRSIKVAMIDPFTREPTYCIYRTELLLQLAVSVTDDPQHHDSAIWDPYNGLVEEGRRTMVGQCPAGIQ